MAAPLYDAHNHLQDERFRAHQIGLWAALEREGVAQMVVNGSSESDWAGVLALARAHPQVIPAFGYHPWFIKERSPEWQKHLVAMLESVPSTVGEIGLDRWIKNYDLADQEQVFVWQLRLAAE